MARKNHLSEEWRELRDRLLAEGWRTPDTYDVPHFASVPPTSGIYILLVSDPCVWPRTRQVAYVGKSRCLAQRLKTNHTVIRAIYESSSELYVQRWFLEMPRAWIGKGEVDAIRRFDPPLNVQHRKRDLRDWGRLVGGTA